MPGKRRNKPRSEQHRQRLDDDHRYKLAILREFVAERGWSELRAKTIYKGVNVFSWVHNRRTEYQTGEIRDFLVPELEQMPGWSWDPRRDRYRRDVDNLRHFVLNHGWDAVTVETEIEGVKLSQWCANRRAEYRRSTIPRWLSDALEAIPGWSWEPIEDHYAERIASLRAHVERNGWKNFRLQTIDRCGVPVGRWANHIREVHRRGTLPVWVVAELEAIHGWTWEPRRDRARSRRAAAPLGARG
jgi:hypothetical protein